MGSLAVGGGPLLLMRRAAACIIYQRGICSVRSTSWRPVLPAGPSLDPASTRLDFHGLAVPWSHQPVRTKARGNEYQPSNIKRKHKHGWIKRIRERSGIEVILRRMLKGRKSLTH
ncbi:39S ribosomal protein L34, mitochondrial [Varanus komodoensis]|uniref:Large ribosomal subunit protein bL34m n=1 Tax=Varanus komodoensis TaxID=61221 RepID=A0A8D2IQ13_VARKO|nr:39S ribosomal protein L34, mitochondrial [Varanus komodoensis]